MFHIQYNEDGTIAATVQGDRTPDHPRQIVLKDAVQTHGKRIDLVTKEIIDCPVFARNQHNAAILYKLDMIDKATMRPLRTGDTAQLQKLEQDAVALRAQLLPTLTMLYKWLEL